MTINDLNDSNNRFVFIKTMNEIIFTEKLGESKTHTTIFNPILVRTCDDDNSSDSFYGTVWFPFTESKVHNIPKSIIIASDKLTDKYAKFYGSVIMQSELSDIQEAGRERIRAGESEYLVIPESFQQMKNVGAALATRFSIDCPDFSDMEKQYKETAMKNLH
jgi:hypothetical protein